MLVLVRRRVLPGPPSEPGPVNGAVAGDIAAPRVVDHPDVWSRVASAAVPASSRGGGCDGGGARGGGVARRGGGRALVLVVQDLLQTPGPPHLAPPPVAAAAAAAVVVALFRVHLVVELLDAVAPLAVRVGTGEAEIYF